MYDLEELINNIVGKNQDGYPKSVTVFGLLELNSEYKVNKELTNVITYAPTVDIKSINDFTILDLVFKNDYDQDLRRLYAALEMYGEKKTKDTDMSDTHTVSSFTIVPIELNGKIAITASEPIFWTLQPHMPGDTINTIRLMFLNDDFIFVESPAVDTNAINETVIKEIEQEKAALRKQIEAEEERNAYLEERNKKLEELRRRGE